MPSLALLPSMRNVWKIPDAFRSSYPLLNARKQPRWTWLVTFPDRFERGASTRRENSVRCTNKRLVIADRPADSTGSGPPIRIAQKQLKNRHPGKDFRDARPLQRRRGL
jgi:hypothetical protein